MSVEENRSISSIGIPHQKGKSSMCITILFQCSQKLFYICNLRL